MTSPGLPEAMFDMAAQKGYLRIAAAAESDILELDPCRLLKAVEVLMDSAPPGCAPPIVTFSGLALA